tara:strand:+ start:40 stop:837 length:798 start_codon:yes stop_codon:yes gene_type:complete
MLKVTPQQKKYKILLIGEACEDVYVYGYVDRISPEAPVPVFSKDFKEKKGGMIKNVLSNIENMSNDNVIVSSFFNDPSLIKKIRFVENKSNYQIMRYDIEKELSPLAVDNKFIFNEKNYDAVVISDYNKGYLTGVFIEKICKYFENTKIFVDTKKKNLSYFKNCVIKINKSERDKCYNIPKNSHVITTLGHEGCLYQGIIYPTKKVDVHDVCGAGDVFLSALVIGWLENKDIIKAINIANNCASLSVTMPGCYSVKRNEYEDLCF